MSASINSNNVETYRHEHQHFICWKSVLGGLFVALMGYLMLTALGAGLGGMFASEAVEAQKGGLGLMSGAGLWLGLSAVISLFAGSYFAARISGFQTNKVGAAHGFVVASLFFLILSYGAASAVGGASKGVFGALQSVGSGSANLSSNPEIQDIIQRSLPQTNLKSDPKEVVQGLSTRLLRGDFDSAKNYYAYETGASSTEVDAKMQQLKTEFINLSKQIGESAAEAVSAAGWSLFVTFLVGLIASVVGGRIGNQANVSRPLAKHDRALSSLQNVRGSVAPYLIGWLLGVPGSILILIFVLRSIF